MRSQHSTAAASLPYPFSTPINTMFLLSLFKQLQRLVTTVPSSPTQGYMGAHGIVTETIVPGRKGRIRVHGVHWYGRLAAPVTATIPAGSIISVLHRDSLTLTVQLVSLPPANVLSFEPPKHRSTTKVS